jgi:importin subunit alpha-1
MTADELIKLAHRADETPSVSMQKNIAWTFSNFCRGTPPPALEVVAPMLPTIYEFVRNSVDEEVLTDTSWALAYLSDCGGDQIQAVLSSDIAHLLVTKLLSHSRYVLLI